MKFWGKWFLNNCSGVQSYECTSYLLWKEAMYNCFVYSSIWTYCSISGSWARNVTEDFVQRYRLLATRTLSRICTCFNDQGNDCNVLKSVTYVSWRQKKPICQSCQKKTVFLVTCFTLDYGVLQSVSIVLYLKMNTMFQLSLKPLKTSEDETSKNETSASLRSSSSLLALAVPSSPRTCLRTLNFPQTLVAPTMVHCKTTSAIPNISQIQQKVLQNWGNICSAVFEKVNQWDPRANFCG